MVKGMTGADRRKQILSLMQKSDQPLPGVALGKETGVSRQVVVQDIALLRTEGYPIVSTSRGYYLDQPKQAVRLIKVCHTNEQVEDELTTIVNLGGIVLDVMINHRTYGKVTAPMHIKCQRDIRRFMQDMRSGKSSPLMNVTSGYHFHHIAAEKEEILDEIAEELDKKGYMVEWFSYEKGL